jgi:hypothetical protein
LPGLRIGLVQRHTINIVIASSAATNAAPTSIQNNVDVKGLSTVCNLWGPPTARDHSLDADRQRGPCACVRSRPEEPHRSIAGDCHLDIHVADVKIAYGLTSSPNQFANALHCRLEVCLDGLDGYTIGFGGACLPCLRSRIAKDQNCLASTGHCFHLPRRQANVLLSIDARRVRIQGHPATIVRIA